MDRPPVHTPRCVRAAACAALLLASPAAATQQDFAPWLAALGAEAVERGISPETVERALASVEPIPRVLELDSRQPSAPSDFCAYMERRLTPTRIARGRRVLSEQEALLAEISAEYGVPPRYLVALWGLETNFGDYMGDYPVMASLVTLARNPRRGDFFREQVFAALRIVDEGHRAIEGFNGSWAGATGQVQLMPTTFLEYAVDYDGDGRKDVWSSLPDSLATAAHYLRRSGWRGGQTWGRAVTVPPGADPAALKARRSVSEWRRRGVRLAGGSDLPESDLEASMVLPLRKATDPAYLAYRNYRTFLAWNNSTFFAVSVGTLADALAGSSHRPCGP